MRLDVANILAMLTFGLAIATVSLTGNYIEATFAMALATYFKTESVRENVRENARKGARKGATKGGNR